ncbi:putative HAF family extracellular repeat protein [Pseudomonas sp. TE3786]
MKSLPFSRSPLAQALSPWHLIPAAVLSTLTLLAAQPAGAVMMDLGNLPNGTDTVNATTISGDGQTVFGLVGTQPFRWTADKGMSTLPAELAGATIYATSSDGRYIVGVLRGPFRWDATNGVVKVGDYTDGIAASVSDDGSVAVGNVYAPPGNYTAFRWTQAGGQQLLGTLGGSQSWALGVSGDGTVVVGESDINRSNSIKHAFRWDIASGTMTDLGGLPGYTDSSAKAANRNGSVVVGTSTSATGDEAFRWSTTKGMQGLGTLGGTSSSASDVNADGSVVVGTSTQADNAARAFRWTAASGMTNLGVLSGATTSAATGVSDDGRTVVGTSGARAFIWKDATPIVPEAGLPDAYTPIGVMQDLVYLQSSLITSADTVNHLINSQNRRLGDLNQSHCQPGAAQRYCLGLDATAYRGEASSNGNQHNLQFAGGMRLNEHYSVGASASLGGAELDVQNAEQTKAYALGLWTAYQQNLDNTGWGGSASVAAGTSNNSFERGVDLSDVQRAQAKLDMRSSAVRIAANYGLQLGTSLVTPEIALSHLRGEQDGFTERNVAFPLTIDSSRSTDTYATLGVRSATPVNAKGTLHLSLAVDTLLSEDTPAIEGSSSVPGLTRFTYNSSLDKRRVVPTAMAGYSHAIDANSTLGGGVQVATAQYQGERAVFGLGVQYRYAF